MHSIFFGKGGQVDPKNQPWLPEGFAEIALMG